MSFTGLILIALVIGANIESIRAVCEPPKVSGGFRRY